MYWGPELLAVLQLSELLIAVEGNFISAGVFQEVQKAKSYPRAAILNILRTAGAVDYYAYITDHP